MEDNNVKYLTLDAIPTLKELIGGGSSVTVLDAYTATPEAGSVYGATYVNARLNGATVALGQSAKNNLAVQQIAIGDGATTGNETIARGAIALGYNANTLTYSGSVAIGSGARCSRSAEVSFGYGSTSGTYYKSRVLANVDTGTEDTDAVNKLQMETYVSEQLGDVETVLQTLTTGTGV